MKALEILVMVIQHYCQTQTATIRLSDRVFRVYQENPTEFGYRSETMLPIALPGEIVAGYKLDLVQQ